MSDKQHNEKEKWYNYEGVEDTVPPTPSKNDLFRLLTRETYASILYILLEKTYTYRKEADKIICVDSRRYIHNLEKLGFVEKFNLDERSKKILKITQNMHDNNFMSFQPYRLRAEAKLFFRYEYIIELLNENASEKAKKYTQELTDKYNYNLDMIEKKYQQEKIQEILNKRKLGIDLSFDEKMFYENLLGRKIK
ncbi:MAG: hypothetical protein ACOC56_05755 [Atribacterota bacterium]